MEAKSGTVQRMHSVSSDDKQAIDQYIYSDSSQNPIVGIGWLNGSSPPSHIHLQE